MIDTGASCSVIKAGIADILGVKPVGVQYVSTPTSQNVRCLRYLIAFNFPSTAGLQVPVGLELAMIEAPLQGQRIQCLLGRDFLSHGIFIYSGPDQTFSFSL
jgi:hypothetical protein